MNHYPQRKASTVVVYLIMGPIAALLVAILASAVAAGLVAAAPGAVARLVQPVLCPADCRATIAEMHGDGITSLKRYQVIKCLDSAGQTVDSNGAAFMGMWWGAWMGGAGGATLLAALALMIRDMARRRGR
jgi:hypothetical protein